MNNIFIPQSENNKDSEDISDEKNILSSEDIPSYGTSPKPRMYLSLPITGHEKTAPIKASEMKIQLQGKGYDVITPYDVSCLKDMPDNYYLGQDITAMLTCEVVYFCRGWELSNGCNVEWFVAKQYQKELQFE